MLAQKFPDTLVSLEGNTKVRCTACSEPLIPSWSRREGRLPCFVWKGFRTFPAHLRMRPVSRGNSRRSVVGGVTCLNTPNSRPTLEKNPMPGHLFEGNPVDEGTKRRVTDTPVHHSVKAAGSTHSSTRGLSSHEQLERQAWLGKWNQIGTVMKYLHGQNAYASISLFPLLSHFIIS